MSLPEASVARPIGVAMATLAIATFGFLAAQQLPVELLPNLSYPTLTVQTDYPDAAPISVEQFVTRPIEEAVGVTAGVRAMRSVSRAGLSEVVLEFDWDEAIAFRAIDVREKLGLVELPREVEPPRVLRYDPSLDPIVRLALSGDRPLDELRQLAERWLKPRLEAVRGVAAAKVRGGLDPEIVVEADEERLATLGLTLDDLGGALESENVNQPGGTLKDFNAIYLVRTLHEFEDLEQIRRTAVRDDAAGRIRIEDVASVRRGHRDREEISLSQGREVIEIALHREGSANTVAVATALREELERLRDGLGDDLSLTVLSDQSRYISDAVSGVWSAALIGGLLAIVVLYFFLGDAPSTVIIGLSIPVSVLATFLAMQRFGVTLNIMSLGGLALGVGMLVDNSIVVLEAIDRRRRSGLTRARAAAEGAGDVAAAVTAATLTTVSVFFPIVFVEGVAGQLFYDQAVTVCFSLVASLIVSLTLIPALSGFDPGESLRSTVARAVEGEEEELPWTLRLGGRALAPIGDGRRWLSRIATAVALPPRLVLLVLVVIADAVWRVGTTAFRTVTWPASRLLESIGDAYPGALRWALRMRWASVGLAVMLCAASIAVVPRLGTRLVPDLSQGEFAFSLEMPEGTPLDATSEVVRRVESLALADGRFERVFSVVGSLPSSASERRTLGENLAQVDFVLPEGSTAEVEAAAIGEVRAWLASLPRVDAELVRPSVLSVQAPIVVQVFADDLDVLDEAARRVRDVVVAVPGVADVVTTLEPGSPEVRVELDRERSGALGLTAADVGRALRDKIHGRLVGEFREGERRLDIRLRSEESARDRSSDVEALRVQLPNGALLPVSAVARVEIDRGPAAIHRASGARVAEIAAQVGDADLGATLERVRSSLRTTALVDGARADMAGQDREIAVSFASLRTALLLAVFLVYVVMAAQFESLVHPLVILTSLPLAVVGVVLALAVAGQPVSVLVLIGAVMLAGIVVNNGIVLVDAVNRRRREGEALDEAIVGAGRERLRPILMTTVSTVLALAPLALGFGAGDELRAPLAITVIGGLGVATVLTLLVTPCLYRILSREKRSGAVAHELASEATP